MKDLTHYKYNDTIIPEKQEISIQIDGKIWSTYKNFSILTGKPKSRKSTFGIGILMGHQTGEEIFNMKVNTAGKCVLIDTEQTHFDFYNSLQRIKGYANIKDLDPAKYEAYLFRMLDTEEILDNIELILLTDPDIKILILDSVTDLVNDINNILEAKNLCQRFKKWSSYGISIVGLLHMGKASGYNSSLGHIGSFLERSSQSMSIIEKSKEDSYQSTCRSMYMRSDIDFNPFLIDFKNNTYDIQEPVTKLSNKNVSPDLIGTKIHLQNLENIRAVHQILSYSELIDVLKSRYGKGETYCKRQLLPYLREQGYLIQDNAKKYKVKL